MGSLLDKLAPCSLEKSMIPAQTQYDPRRSERGVEASEGAVTFYLLYNRLIFLFLLFCFLFCFKENTLPLFKFYTFL